jgi:hypothetical protein
MTLSNRPAAATGATGASQAALIPLLRTAKRVKRSLTPVQPSLAFRASLEGELLQVARRLAMSRGHAPRTVVGKARLAGVRREQVGVILGALTAVSLLVALILLVWRAGQEQPLD